MKIKSMFLLAGVMSAVAVPTLGDNHGSGGFVVEKVLELKDGGNLFVYRDGKMAVEDKYGKPAAKVRPGAVVQTATGDTVTIRSNEVERLKRAPVRGD